MEASAASKGASSTSKGTRDYAILSLQETGLWELAGTARATSAADAIRRTAERDGEGKYVAVPSRSWKPVVVTVEKTTVVKLGTA